MKQVLVFGSTGSVGRSALEVIRNDSKNFKVAGLCAYGDIKTLYSQVKEFNPKYVCVVDEHKVKRFSVLSKSKHKLFSGFKGLEEFSSLNCDISVMAISGISCLKPLLINIEHTKRIALANKESIVAAGKIVFERAKKYKAEIIPVDSEINALFQLINSHGAKMLKFKKVYLTASGGSLAGYKRKDFCGIKVKDVLSHPTWRMGKRITVDCATLVNKGFEAVETHHFFNIPYERIDILLHKESFVHGLVEFEDSTIFACIYPPDMKMPISHAFYYPLRNCLSLSGGIRDGLSWSFSPLLYKNYPLLNIILEGAKRKDNSLIVINACDEVAVDAFVKGKIKFIDIYKALEFLFEIYPKKGINGINDVFYWDNWGRIKTKEFLKL
ncbi:MAG: 1-deoxy-D-xylulose-5-phosphate reductoisomerase [Candidatus Omnitrophota bacterium]